MYSISVKVVCFVLFNSLKNVLKGWLNFDLWFENKYRLYFSVFSQSLNRQHEVLFWIQSFIISFISNISRQNILRFAFALALLVLFPFSFGNVEHAKTFDCDFIHIKVMKINGIYKCIAKNLTILSELERISSIGGFHKEQKTSEDVQILIIANQVCHYLPKSLNLHFPKIYHLDVRNSGLKGVNSEQMIMFPKLRHLYFRNNPIEVLPENLFQHNPLLEFIDLSDNRIKTVGRNIFEPLDKLVALNIERNVCIDGFAIEEESIKNLKSEINRKCSQN